MKISDIIGKMHDVLSVPGVWNQGRYFYYPKGTLCMCVHGASAMVRDPSRMGTPEAHGWRTGMSQREETQVDASFSAMSARVAHSNQQDPFTREYFSKKSWAEQTAHLDPLGYALGMVGLTPTFNDSHPLEDILAKLVEAKALAISLGL